MRCNYCTTTSDLRPYGPKGAMVCFDCAMSTPERKAETERAFVSQLDAAGPVSVIDGTEVGPYPIEHNPEARCAYIEVLEQEDNNNGKVPRV